MRCAQLPIHTHLRLVYITPIYRATESRRVKKYLALYTTLGDAICACTADQRSGTVCLYRYTSVHSAMTSPSDTFWDVFVYFHTHAHTQYAGRNHHAIVLASRRKGGSLGRSIQRYRGASASVRHAGPRYTVSLRTRFLVDRGYTLHTRTHHSTVPNFSNRPTETNITTSTPNTVDVPTAHTRMCA